MDDDNSSYQVFLRLNFEFGEAKINPKTIAKPAEATKPNLEIKEVKDVKKAKEIDNVEQTIDELLAADVEALEELSQEIEVLDIETIKQPK